MARDALLMLATAPQAVLQPQHSLGATASCTPISAVSHTKTRPQARPLRHHGRLARHTPPRLPETDAVTHD